MTSPRFALPYIQSSQSQKEVTHNEALRQIDALLQLVLEDRHLSTPPASPTEGKVWFVASGASGDWNGQSGKLAHYVGGAWYFYAVPSGALAWIVDEAGLFTFNGTAWEVFSTAPFVPITSITANYAATLANRGALIAADATSAALEIRLPLAASGFPVSVKKTDASANAITIRAAENRLLYSQDASNAAWTKTRLTVSVNTTTAPDGTTTADTLVETTDTGVHEAKISYSKPSGITRLTAAVRLKAAGRSEAYLMLDDGTSTNRVQIRASLADGSVTFTDAAGYTLVTHSVTALGNGWYLLQLTADVPSGAASLVQTVRLYNASASYAGDGASGIYLWGAQLVAGSVLGDYLATTSVAVIGLIDGSETRQLTSQYETVQLVCGGNNWLVL